MLAVMVNKGTCLQQGKGKSHPLTPEIVLCLTYARECDLHTHMHTQMEKDKGRDIERVDRLTSLRNEKRKGKSELG